MSGCVFEIACYTPQGTKERLVSGPVACTGTGDWCDPERGLAFSWAFEPVAEGLRLRIPGASLREDGKYKLGSITICCSAFHGTEGDGGTFMTPYASGYLTHTHGHRPAEHLLAVFNERKWQVSWGNMPLYGFFRDGRCRIGLLEEGRFDADLRLRTAYGAEKSYALDPVLYIRQEPLEPAAGGDRTLLLAEVEGDWRAAAKWYRRYNLEVRKLPTIAERVRTEPDLAYSTRSLTIRCRMAVKPLPTQILEQRPENEPAPRVFLTFDNVREIAEEFARQGVGPSEFCLVGWNHGGHDGAFPQLFPVADGCGSEDDLRGLIDRMNALGYHLSLHDNYYDGYTLARNFDFDDVCREFGEYGGPMVGGGRLGGGQAYRVCPARAVKYAEANFAEVKRRLPGLHGPYFVDVISIIPMKPCSHPRHPLDRRGNSECYRRILKLQHDTFGLSMSEGGRDWALPELDRTYMIYNLDRPVEPFCDEHVPLYQMAYHGIVLYNNCRLFINTLPGDRAYVENLAWGGLPMLYYHHIFNPSWGAGGGWSLDLTYEGPEKLAADVAVFKRMSDDVVKLSPLQQTFMEDFIRHDNGLTETVYANGMRLFVNAEEHALPLPGGETVPARDFLLMDREGNPVP